MEQYVEIDFAGEKLKISTGKVAKREVKARLSALRTEE